MINSFSGLLVYLLKLKRSSFHIVAFIWIFQILFQVSGNSQNNVKDLREIYQLKISRSSEQIIIDGELSENSWQTADVATNFWIKFPRDDIRAKRITEVRMCYDEHNIYISAVCYDTSHYVVQTLKRDSRFFESDGFGVVLDPVNKRANGFLFGVNPMNVQSEDLISPTFFGQPNFSWDNKWFSEVRRHSDRWIVEMAIPFKTLRFEVENASWGINFFRLDLKSNQIHSWTRNPVNFEPQDIGYTGALIWDIPPPKTGTNISLIPYISGSVYRDNEANPIESNSDLDGGFDAKIGLTSSLNLDLTFNPEFSQIEVDEQQTNLTRFSLDYPEKRPFFLENNDLFTNYGTPPARPIYTRSIGLDEQRMPVPILYGARMSGNLSNNLRIGVLNLHTKAGDTRDGQNYSMLTFNQSVLDRSVIKGYVTNRQLYIKGEGFDENNFGRNLGLEFNYKNISGTWNPWAAVHLSDKSNIGKAMFRNAGVSYSSRNLSFLVDYIGIDSDYYADMGFIPRLNNYDADRDTTIRLGFEHLFTNLEYTIRPSENNPVNVHQIAVQTLWIVNPDWTLNERTTELQYQLQFKNTSEIGAGFVNSDIRLLYAARFTDGHPLPPDQYKFSQFSISYQSDARKAFAFESQIHYGGFYNGDLFSLQAGLTYRTQPWGNFSIGFEQNSIKFPEPYGEDDLFLINQRTEVNFSNKLFWTTFLQYNTQENNFNINSRLQYRYQPMSDFYLVYTDNYFSDPFLKNKNRGVVFKLNYWFTL